MVTPNMGSCEVQINLNSKSFPWETQMISQSNFLLEYKSKMEYRSLDFDPVGQVTFKEAEEDALFQKELADTMRDSTESFSRSV